MTPLALASVALDLFAAVLAPPRCASCDDDVTRLRAFCGPCASTIAPGRSDAADLAAFVYGGAIAQAIVRFKYGNRPDLARPLGDLLWRAVEPHASRLAGARVVPVPLHPSRLAERGYNQSTLLARRVAAHLGAPLHPVTLARTRDTTRQATLEKETRATNVAHAFHAAPSHWLHGSAVLLVDDVKTTGSTLRACTEALREAGAVDVVTAVLARAE